MDRMDRMDKSGKKFEKMPLTVYIIKEKVLYSTNFL